MSSSGVNTVQKGARKSGLEQVNREYFPKSKEFLNQKNLGRYEKSKKQSYCSSPLLYGKLKFLSVF